METERDDDYRKPLPETRQEELDRIAEAERQTAMNRLIDGEDPEFERALKWSGYFLSDREKIHIAATFWYLAREQPKASVVPCSQCGGKGHYMYDHNHGKPCEQCCPHAHGWWELTESHAGYKAGEDNGCCRVCGQLRRELRS